MDSEVVKKKMRRVWNPAVEDELVTSPEAPMDMTPEKLIGMATMPFLHPPIPFFLQNYLHFAAPLMAARMHQRRAMEDALRPKPNPMFLAPPPMSLPASPPRLSPASSSPPPQCPSSSGSSTTSNPIVQMALGVHVPNENCCAICGAFFRLTGDLVQHMRTNHRRQRFKRKHEEEQS